MVLIFFISPLRQREGRSQEAGWGRRSLHFLLLLFLLYASFFSARLLWCPLRSYGDYRRLAVVCIERRGRGEVGGLFFLVSFAPHSALANIRSPPTLCDPWNPHNSNDNNNNRNNKRKKCRPGRKTWRHRLRWWPFSGDQFVGSITVDRTIDVSWFFVFFFVERLCAFGVSVSVSRFWPGRPPAPPVTPTGQSACRIGRMPPPSALCLLTISSARRGRRYISLSRTSRRRTLPSTRADSFLTLSGRSPSPCVSAHNSAVNSSLVYSSAVRCFLTCRKVHRAIATPACLWKWCYDGWALRRCLA